jgi:hypothetical protein
MLKNNIKGKKEDRMHQYITDEIREYINRLVSKGKTGTSNSYNGITQADESHLISLLIQAIPYNDLPKLHDLDIYNAIPLMISRFIAKQDQRLGNELSFFIADLYYEHFMPFIKELFENATQEFNEKDLNL